MDRLGRAEAELARWQLRAGQLVIVDEASLAGTFALDELVAAAGDAGAKVLLVGDPPSCPRSRPAACSPPWSPTATASPPS